MKRNMHYWVKKILLNIWISFFLVFFSCSSAPKQPVPEKPNVIFVLADQWRAQAMGYSGDLNLSRLTPNLDRMAATCVNFTNAISVCPVSSPNRASLLTGQYPTTNGIFMNDLHLRDDAVTMAEIYKASGYQTAYIGKWHVDGMGRLKFTPPERRQGFDYWKALECSHDYNHMLYYSGDSDEQLYWPGYSPYAETADAIQYIQQHAGKGKPFLLFLSWAAPHFPHNTAPEELQKLFNPDSILLEANVPEGLLDAARKESVGYYAHIAALDHCMGDLMKAIREAGISENTILVFTSDHGEMMGSQGVSPKQKQVPWAESVKVPFLLQYPARFGKDGTKISTPISTPDVLPTLLSLSGLQIPGMIEGEDMTGVITNPEKERDKAALIMSVSPFTSALKEEYRGIYTSRYAYVETLNGAWLLYDNNRDSLQMDNLAGKDEYKGLQEQLAATLKKELGKIGDEFKPRDYYIKKWGYKVNKFGYIDY